MNATRTSASPLGPGSHFGGYRILDLLGEGGSGTVYRATESMSGRVVALKVMNAEHAGDDSERQRFAREAELIKRLAHPHVVGLLDYGFQGELPYLVFPFLEGETLDERIARDGALGWELVGRFAEQALSALEMAHAMGIAHRDIKPANLFVSRGPEGESVRLLDFGTAKIVGTHAQEGEVTRAGVIVGTPRYMAPEQVRGEPLTPAADVYAFGLVMAEMLLGRPLVSGTTDFEMFVTQGSDAAHVLPEEVRRSPFAAIVTRAVAKPVDVRYRLASQMLADVRAISSRVSHGEIAPPEADLEATSYLGFALAPAGSESSEKLRAAFNAIASRSKPPPPPEPAPLAPVPPEPAPAGHAPLDAVLPSPASHGPLPAPTTRRGVGVMVIVLLVACAVAVGAYVLRRGG